MWYQTDGCAKQYSFSIAYYLMYVISKSYQIVLDRAVYTPGHVKYAVGGFNDVKKQYLDTFLIMRRTPGVENIDSKRMHVYAMTKNGEVRFAKECKLLLDLCGEVGTKGDKKHVKREAKARFKHKYYWIHKDEEIIFNGMKAVYKILNNQDKVKIKHFYHIRCYTDLDKGFCAIRHKGFNRILRYIS